MIRCRSGPCTSPVRAQRTGMNTSLAFSFNSFQAGDHPSISLVPAWVYNASTQSIYFAPHARTQHQYPGPHFPRFTSLHARTTHQYPIKKKSLSALQYIPLLYTRRIISLFYFNCKYSFNGNAIQSAACFCAALLLLLKLPKTGIHEKPTLCAYHKPDFSSLLTV